MQIDDLVYDINQQVREALQELELVSAELGGLDRRSGRVYVSDSYVIAEGSNVRYMNYYGGFEYVDKECTITIGNFTFWSCEDDRVREFMDAYYDNTSDNDGQPDEAQEWYDYDPGC